MPATKRFAGMARSYKRLTPRLSCMESTGENHRATFAVMYMKIFDIHFYPPSKAAACLYQLAR
jgi:hypothetical protein